MIRVQGPIALYHPGYVAGRFYGASPSLNTGLLTAANTIYYCPIPIYRPCKIDQAIVRVTVTSTAGGKGRVGFYSDNGGRPLTLLAAGSTEVDATSITAQAIALSATISVGPGLIWGAYFADGSVVPPTMEIISGGQMSALAGCISALDSQTANSGALSQSLAYTTLPTTVGTLAAIQFVPNVTFRAA